MLAERIKAISEAKFPIQYVATPEKPKDCRVKIMRQEMARILCTQKIWAGVNQIITDNKAAAPGIITKLVNNYLETYIEKHPD
jgi:hypothetical protein